MPRHIPTRLWNGDTVPSGSSLPERAPGVARHFFVPSPAWRSHIIQRARASIYEHLDNCQYQSRQMAGDEMLEMRPNCECCDRDLPPSDTAALICSFECTFCASCGEDRLGGRCPNCGGNLVARPTRADHFLEKSPASTMRILKPEGCAASFG
ncbi:DUF1272 domain-containing protein [Gluconacetobacter azotocaptans]|uniref:DUF1272 domain-containing protein n=1 Tax=Gluconacetobacter azotocaptans TaxID=142834 RepID=UPI0030B81B8C